MDVIISQVCELETTRRTHLGSSGINVCPTRVLNRVPLVRGIGRRKRTGAYVCADVVALIIILRDKRETMLYKVN